MARASKHWIAGAVKRPGALRRTAKQAGLVKGNQRLTMADINKLAKSSNPTTRRRANLARTFAKLRGK